ncbi:hypothetical protein HanPI659440_Chr01g0028721 [Helianthus annuus]|nr:hypothetical protein HanPI659440_Chr01g0028721 [Helianthus annuus]
MTPEERAALEKRKGVSEGDGKNRSNQDDSVLDKPYLPKDLAEVSKFTKRIAEAPLPPKLKPPINLDGYDGTKDPEDHLHAFRGAGQVGRWSMPTWCHMFVQTLTEGARLWFDSLPAGSIDSYEDLSDVTTLTKTRSCFFLVCQTLHPLYLPASANLLICEMFVFTPATADIAPFPYEDQRPLRQGAYSFLSEYNRTPGRYFRSAPA